MPAERIEVPPAGHAALRITARSAAVSVTTGEVDAVEIDGRDHSTTSTHRRSGVEVHISARSSPVTVRVPEGTDVVLGLASGTVRLEGRYGDVRVTTRSGRVEIDDARSVDVRTASGSVEVGCCEGECRVMSRSGRVHVGTAAELRAATKSGSIRADAVDAVTVHTSSGRLDLGVTGRGDLDLHAMSGAATITVADEARPDLSVRTLSGTVRNECGEGDDFTIAVKTVSCSVSVVRG